MHINNQAESLYLEKLHFDQFFNLPGVLFFKDINGHYQWCNQQMLVDAGLSTINDIIGCCDSHSVFSWRDCASLLMLHDEMVFQQQQSTTFLEYGVQASGKHVSFMTKKTPVFDQSDRMVGVFGIALTVSDYSAESKFIHDLQTLSKRELQVLQQVVMGKTSKDIGKTLSLSARTVEAYIVNINHKLNCESKTALIIYTLKHGFGSQQ